MKLIKMMPTVTLVVVNIFFLPACATTTVPPPAPGTLAVKILPAVDVRIVQTSARQEGEYLVVDGQIKRKKVHARKFPRGHIDIAILDEDGSTIDKTFTKISPEILPRIDGMKSTFLARIPLVPPQGSVVRVNFHSGPHES